MTTIPYTQESGIPVQNPDHSINCCPTAPTILLMKDNLMRADGYER